MIWLPLASSLLCTCQAIVYQFPVTLQWYTPSYKTTTTWSSMDCCPKAASTLPSPDLDSAGPDGTTTVTSTSTIYVTIYSRSTGNWTRNLVPRTNEPAMTQDLRSTF